MCVCACEAVRVSADDSSVTAVYARLQSDVTLPCAATPHDTDAASTHVQWLDYVYNSDQHPLLIFSSRDNPTRLIHHQHPQRQVSLLQLSSLLYAKCLFSNITPKFIYINAFTYMQFIRRSLLVAAASRHASRRLLQCRQLPQQNGTCGTVGGCGESLCACASRSLLRPDWMAGRPAGYKSERRQYVGSLSLIMYAMLSDVNPHYLYLYVGSLEVFSDAS